MAAARTAQCAIALVSALALWSGCLESASARDDMAAAQRESESDFDASTLQNGRREAVRILPRASADVGSMIPDFGWTDVRGTTQHLTGIRNQEAFVIAVHSTSCPLSGKWAPALERIERDYTARGVQFIRVNPIATDDPAAMRAIAEAHPESIYIHDTDNTITRLLGATTTTELFVLDSARTLIYRGAVNDQFGIGFARASATADYLRDALDAILGNRMPLVRATTAPGCALDLTPTHPALNPSSASQPAAISAAPPKSASLVTYYGRVSRIVQDRCLSCHHDNGVAPFSLATYLDLVSHKGMVRRVVDDNIMPPWPAAPQPHGAPSPWINDQSLTAAEKADLLAWIENGCVAGNKEDAPRPIIFSDDWHIGTPDMIVQLPEPIDVKADGVMPYKHVFVDVDLPEDRWVQALEIRPTDASVVHHVLVHVVPAKRGLFGGQRRGFAVREEDGFFAGYVPGNSFVTFPDGMARKLPAGARLRFQLHYTPTGKATKDQTRLGLVFADTPPNYELRVYGIANHRFKIPPGEAHHEVTASISVPRNVRAAGFMPHMHLRGAAFRYELITPDGQRTTLLDVPHYDFNWQLSYRLADPMAFPPGSRIQATGWFDNSSANPANPDATKTVRWGPQTFDEMMIGYIEYLVPLQ